MVNAAPGCSHAVFTCTSTCAQMKLGCVLLTPQELETQLEDERTRSVALRGEIAEAESKASEAVGLVAAERAKLAAELEAAELKVCFRLCYWGIRVLGQGVGECE